MAEAFDGDAVFTTPSQPVKKGLTDEARKTGKPTNKGGHKTAQMKRYVCCWAVTDAGAEQADKNPIVFRLFSENGAGEVSRTPDLLITNQKCTN